MWESKALVDRADMSHSISRINHNPSQQSCEQNNEALFECDNKGGTIIFQVQIIINKTWTSSPFPESMLFAPSEHSPVMAASQIQH